MRRRSLRLLRPKLILNSEGDTGEFFSGEKLSKITFCSITRRPEVVGIALRVNFIKGRKQVKRTADLLS